ncbi:STAS domain-containing protein [Streptomyces sp. NPDC058695]|uniref:STAS domain-containing protein n=1 Tax=Streptomyces sp. NPDC058695 TaxID=3346604 RepID=UPI00364ABE63
MPEAECRNRVVERDSPDREFIQSVTAQAHTTSCSEQRSHGPSTAERLQARLNVYRHDSGTGALITLAGEIDLAKAPLVREALAECLPDGMRSIDVDLTAETFCDASGLNAFLMASRLATDAGRASHRTVPVSWLCGCQTPGPGASSRACSRKPHPTALLKPTLITSASRRLRRTGVPVVGAGAVRRGPSQDATFSVHGYRAAVRGGPNSTTCCNIPRICGPRAGVDSLRSGYDVRLPAVRICEAGVRTRSFM